MRKKIIAKSLSRYLAVQAIFNQSFGFDKKKIEQDFFDQNDSKFNIDLDCELDMKKFNKIFLKKFLIMFLKRKNIFTIL